MKKKPLIIISLVIICLIIIVGSPFVLKSSKESSISNPMAKILNEPTKIASEFSASFAIYTNGTFRIFTDAMYHDLSPDVYISGNNPNVIIVKKEGTTWEDFFSTLPFELSNECLTTGTGQTFCTNETYTLQFYLNEEFTENILEKEIRQGDKLLVTFDTPNPTNLPEQLHSIPEPN